MVSMMRMRGFVVTTLAAALACFVAPVLSGHSKYVSPAFSNHQSGSSKYVSDPDGIISAVARARIAEQLQSLDEDGPKFPCGEGPNRGYQFAIALFDTIGAEDIEQFSASLFNQMGLGYKECNNGVLFVLARRDRKNYVKTGKGAHQVLMDRHAADILESLKPELRAGDYDAAIAKAVNRIVDEALSRGEAPWHYSSWIVCFLNMIWENLFLSVIVAGCAGVCVQSYIAKHRKITFETKLKRLQIARSLHSKQGSDAKSLCPICIEDLPQQPEFKESNVEQGVELLKCGHVFHDKCVATWLKRQDACPLCRQQQPRIDAPSCDPSVQKRGGSHEAHGSRSVMDADDNFWAFAFNNLSDEYSDVPGVSRAQQQLRSRNFGEQCDFFSCYRDSAAQVRAEEAARARAREARTASSSFDSGSFGGGSCNSGGGAGGSW